MRIPFHMIKPCCACRRSYRRRRRPRGVPKPDRPIPVRQAASTRALPTVNSASPAARNPYVNPNAAGTQLHRPNMAAPTGPNGTQPGNLLVPDDKGMSRGRSAQAHRGEGLRPGLRPFAQDRNFWWEGTAMKNGHQVRVAVDHAGNVTEQR